MPASPEGGSRRWHLLVEPGGAPGWRQMATDRALLDLAVREGTLVLRLYAWRPHCLSFGAHEPALRRYDRDRITQLGLDTVRRPTGGRAVWHARELTYAVAAPAGLLGSLPDAYCAIHRVLAAGVARLGASPTLAPSPSRAAPVGAGACFATPAGGEVMLDGCKVLGSAQVRVDGGLLQHGSLLLEDDQHQVRELTVGDPGSVGERPLAAALGRPVSWAEAADAVAGAFVDWRGTDPEGAPDSGALARDVERWATRFRDPAWTWRR